jgi:hypothetical protein
MSSNLDSEILLAVDVGSVHTRAILFDVVDGQYRLVATGRVPSTSGAPLFDISEGVRNVLDELKRISGRTFIDETENLIMPVASANEGVDRFMATATAGPKVRTILVGLMPGVSMESVHRLAAMSYLDVVGEINLMDRRRDEEQIDVIMSARPDLILIAGGTDGGASDSVIRMVETVSLASRLLPLNQQPRIIYAGNQAIVHAVEDYFGDWATLIPSLNIRPSLDMEDIAPTRKRVTDGIAELRAGRISGFDELVDWSEGNFLLTADAFGRVIRYLSQVYSPEKGVLGIDLGASQVTVAAAFDGDLNVSILTDLGMGASLDGILERNRLNDIKRWLPVEMPDSHVRDYIHNKTLFPRTVPTVLDELHLEHALAREIVRLAVKKARQGWSGDGARRSSALMPPLEPIIGSGGVLTGVPRPEFAVLILLDAIQPTGITTLVLDPNSLTPALGVAASQLPVATVQVLETGSYISLGTIIAPVGRSRRGRRMLTLRLERLNGGEEISGEVRKGQLVRIPLSQGEQGRLTIRPERGIDVGFGGPGKAGTIRVSGGVVGLVIDGRGRPLQLSKDPAHRRELNQKWLWDIGAME